MKVKHQPTSYFNTVLYLMTLITDSTSLILIRHIVILYWLVNYSLKNSKPFQPTETFSTPMTLKTHQQDAKPYNKLQQ